MKNTISQSTIIAILNFIKSSTSSLNFLIFLILLLNFGCKKDLLVNPNSSSNVVSQNLVLTKPYKVELEDAIKVALGFNGFENDNALKNGKGSILSDIESKDIIYDETGNSLLYVINFKKAGFVIISTDLRTMPILAFSNSNKFDFQNYSQTNGLSEWIISAKKQMIDISNGNAKADSISLKEWKKYHKNILANPKNGTIQTTASTNCMEYYTIGQYLCKNVSNFTSNPSYPNQRAPLLTYDTYNPNGIQWNQLNISNYYCPPTSVCNPVYCNKFPAGCGPVAMAQVLWYLKPTKNNTYQFTTMPQISYISNICSFSQTSQLSLANLVRDCGSHSGAVYGVAGTCNTLTLPSNIPSALSYWTSSGGSLSSFSPWTIEQELSGNHPVILTAANSNPLIVGLDQHIWVCDGYNENIYSTYNCDTKACDTWSYLYLYYNWGWGGSSNGWYNYSNFSPTANSGNYNSNVRMITGIRK